MTSSSSSSAGVKDRGNVAVDTSVLKKYRIHPAADIFPMMSGPDLQEMADDIASHGLQEAVWMSKGQVLDGRNRLVACNLAGVEPTFQEWVPRRENDIPTTFIWSRNGPRRHLTQSQRAALAVRMEETIVEENKRLRADFKEAKAKASLFSDSKSAVDSPTPAGLVRTPGARLEFYDPNKVDVVPVPTSTDAGAGFPVSPFGRLSIGRARDQAAKAARVSSGYVNDAKDLRKADPAAFAKVESGELSLPQAQEKVVSEAQEAGRLDQVPIRAGVKNAVIARIEGRRIREETPAKPRIEIKKFGSIASSRTSISVFVTFGNETIAEEYLNKLQDDPRVLEMDYDVIGAKSNKKK